MNDFTKKIKDGYEKIKKGHISYSKEGLNPSHHWKIILTSTALAIIILAVVAFYFYKKVGSGEMFIIDINESGGEVRINNNLLQKVVEEIKLREETQAKIKNNQLSKPDPSV